MAKKLSYFLFFLFSIPHLCALDVERLKNEPVLPDLSPQRWAIALDAMHSTAMNAGLDKLCWGAPTEENVKFIINDLATGPWRVRNKEEVLNAIDYTKNKGHSRQFYDLGEKLHRMTDVERDAYIKLNTDDEQMKSEIDIALKYYSKDNREGLWAWDLTRSIALCRRAYTAGYFERQEAWDEIMPIANDVQRRFSSWAGVKDNYLLGRMFWSKSRGIAGNKDLDKIAEKIFSDKKSPWNTLPWDMKL